MAKATSRKSKKAPEIPQDLETALKALEKTVEKLDESDLPLEDSIDLFERGTKLSEICYERLKEAEKKVELLVKKVPNPQSDKDFEREDFAGDDF